MPAADTCPPQSDFHRAALECEEFARRGRIAGRLIDGLRRRARRWASRLHHDDPHVALEQACEYLPIAIRDLFARREPFEQAAQRTDIANAARLAALSFEMQQLAQGNRLLRSAYRMWHRQGSAHSIGDAWWLLEAARAQVCATFAAGQGGTAQALSPDDPRFQAVCEWGAMLPAGSVLADLGCGTGRYLSLLSKARPELTLVAIDPDARSLAQTPAPCVRRLGDLLNIPASDGELDAAMAVESLEHALLPRQAIAELCRCVRPGGRVLIIDKHRGLQSLSHHHPWERWFEPSEICDWLAPWCEQIACRPLPHAADRAAIPLFWCWTAVRR